VIGVNDPVLSEKGDSGISTIEKGDSGISTIHDNDERSRDTPQSPFSPCRDTPPLGLEPLGRELVAERLVAERQSPFSGDLPLLQSVENWAEYLGGAVGSAWVESFRKATQTGRPMGSDEFVKRMEAFAGRRLHALPRGRPKMEAQ